MPIRVPKNALNVQLLLTLLAVSLFFLESCRKKSDANAITSFTIEGFTPTINATIGSNDSITFVSPPGTSPAGLVPTIQVSEKATVSPASGLQQDFSKTIAYVVTSENGSTRTYYAKAISDIASSPKAKPLAPKSLCIFYGYPSLVNGSGTISSAVNEFAQFDVIVFGDRLYESSHPDHSNTAQVIAGLKAVKPSIQVFGYIDVGNTQRLSRSQLNAATDSWKAMGATGVFGDEFGYDYGMTRVTQNAFVDYAHGKGMKVFANAWSVDDALADYAGEATHLNAGDYYLLESFLIAGGKYSSLGEFKTRSDRAYYYMRKKGVGVAAVTTLSAGMLGTSTNNTNAFKFAWCGAAMYNFDAFQFTESNYSASNSRVWYFPNLSTSYGDSWPTDWVTQVSPTEYSRSTNTKTITVIGDGNSYGQGRVAP